MNRKNRAAVCKLKEKLSYLGRSEIVKMWSFHGICILSHRMTSVSPVLNNICDEALS
jgi:hypothetical protein